MPDIRSEAARPGRVYPWYVLAVLVLVYVLNFIDRQIVVILAERIKADLKVTDAQLGFLYGTVFAVFFAVFAIPLGRLADAWDRRRLIAWGTAFWSLMTALSGFAKSFPQLALARMGVGVGEASAAPAAYSLLSDWFPKGKRATVLGHHAEVGAHLRRELLGLVAVDRRADGQLATRAGMLVVDVDIDPEAETDGQALVEGAAVISAQLGAAATLAPLHCRRVALGAI